MPAPVRAIRREWYCAAQVSTGVFQSAKMQKTVRLNRQTVLVGGIGLE